MPHVHLHSDSGYEQELRARSHSFTADEPRDNGGSDTGPSPYELLLGALAACTSLTLRMYADRKQWQLGAIHVDAHFKHDEAGKESITRELAFSHPLTQEQLQRLTEICEKTPVTRTLKRTVPIVTTIRKDIPV